MRVRRSATLAVALTLLSGACIGRGGGSVPGIFSVSAITGSSTARFPGATDWRPLVKGEEVPGGTAIRLPTVTDVLTLTRGTQVEIELRANEEPPDGGFGAEAVVVAIDEIVIQTGDALARSDGALPLRLRSADDGIAASGAGGTFRLDRRTSLRIGVYAGTVEVNGPAGAAPLPALREAQPRNGAPGLPQPLRLTEGDAWDVRFLGDALDLDRDLAAQIAGYEGEFGDRTRSVDDLSQIARDAGRDVSFVRATLDRPAGDVLVSLMLALLLEARNAAEAPRAYAEMLGLRASGATWGLVATERHVSAADALAAVVRGVGLRTGDVQPGRGSIDHPTTPPTSKASSTPRPTRTPRTTPPPTTPPRTTPPPTTPPPTTPPPTTTPCSDVDKVLGNC